MFENIQNLTIPFISVASTLIALELCVSKARERNNYAAKDTLCNLTILTLSRLSQPLFLGYVYGSLTVIQTYRLFEIPENVWTTLVAVVLTDFAYYWEHRFSHKMKCLWFFHEVHHSSKKFNLTTSFRLHWLNRLTAPIIFAPLVLLGFKPEQVALFFVINLLYQFWLHTEVIDKLGPLEGVLNTPSAHRVHHARNRIYIDKNFGGMLMIWDRLFSTYQAEIEEPRFGIIGKFESNNPLTVQFHNVPGYSRLAAQFSKSSKVVLSVLTTILACASSVKAQEQPIEKKTTTIRGEVEMQDQMTSSLLGRWKATVHEIHRHPKLFVQSLDGNKFQGVYSGLFGKFPMTGELSDDNQSFVLHVDFSRMRHMPFLKNKNMVAEVTGCISGDTISGTGFLPDWSDKIVHFDAKRDDSRL